MDAQTDHISSSDSDLTQEARQYYNDLSGQCHKEKFVDGNEKRKNHSSNNVRNDENTTYLRMGIPTDDPGVDGINPLQYPILMEVRKFPASVSFNANISNAKGYEFVVVQNDTYTLEGNIKLPEEEFAPPKSGSAECSKHSDSLDGN